MMKKIPQKGNDNVKKRVSAKSII